MRSLDRAYSPENFLRPVQNDFCNKICQEATSAPFSDGAEYWRGRPLIQAARFVAGTLRHKNWRPFARPRVRFLKLISQTQQCGFSARTRGKLTAER